MPETENKTLQDIEHFFIGDLDNYEDCDNLKWLIGNKLYNVKIFLICSSQKSTLFTIIYINLNIFIIYC